MPRLKIAEAGLEASRGPVVLRACGGARGTRFSAFAVLSVSVLVLCAPVAVAQTTPAPAPAPAPPPPSPPSSLPDTRPIRPDTLAFDLFMRRDSRREGNAYRTAISFARCAIRLRARRLGDLLAEQPGSREEARIVRALSRTHKTCAIGSAYVPVALFRGALAELLVLRDTGPGTLPVARTLDAERYRTFNRSVPLASVKLGEPMLLLQRAAQCHAVLAPGLARDILSTKFGSKAEGAGFRTLYSTIPACAGPVWPQRISVPLQRAVLAESLYHWLQTSPQGLKAAALSEGKPRLWPIAIPNGTRSNA